MVKKLLSVLTVVCFAAGLSYAAAKGTSGAQFLKIVASPRASALGSAFVGFADDVNSTAFNPAGLGFLEKSELTLVQNSWIQDISNQYVAFGMPSSAGTFGVNVVMLSAKDIVRRDSSGYADGTKFESSDMAAGLSYAKAFGAKFAMGLNAKTINQKIDTEKASGFAGDIGFLYKTSPKFNLGVSVLNIGSSVKFINEADPLPMTIKAGGMYAPSECVKIGLEASMPNDADTNVGVGAEYVIKAGEKLAFPLRVGYRTGYETEQMSGLTAGGGVLYDGSMGVDFAWVPMGILGDSIKFGLTFKF